MTDKEDNDSIEGSDRNIGNIAEYVVPKKYQPSGEGGAISPPEEGVASLDLVLTVTQSECLSHFFCFAPDKKFCLVKIVIAYTFYCQTKKFIWAQIIFFVWIGRV